MVCDRKSLATEPVFFFCGNNLVSEYATLALYHWSQPISFWSSMACWYFVGYLVALNVSPFACRVNALMTISITTPSTLLSFPWVEYQSNSDSRHSTESAHTSTCSSVSSHFLHLQQIGLEAWFLRCSMFWTRRHLCRYFVRLVDCCADTTVSCNDQWYHLIQIEKGHI